VSHMHMADIHNKQEKLIQLLNKEKEKNKMLDSVIQEKDVQFNNYILKTNSKISFLSSVLQLMREQYQGAIPLAILENIKNLQFELKQKCNEMEESNCKVKQIKDDLYNETYDELFGKFAENAQCNNDDVKTQCFHLIELEIKVSVLGF
jgi:hypothetical protein